MPRWKGLRNRDLAGSSRPVSRGHDLGEQDQNCGRFES